MTRPRKSGPDNPGLATERVVGMAAVRAVLEARPGDVLNLAHGRDARAQVRDILRLLAQHRIAYRELASTELDRLADTVHHEGVCMLVRAREPMTLTGLVKRLDKPGFVLALDHVDNPHNVGAILRSAAFFGAHGLLCSVRGERAGALTPAVVRIAEGGAERVPVLFTSNLSSALEKFATTGAAVIGADGAAPTSVKKLQWPPRSVIVLGNEREGLSASVRARCNHQVRIAGTGHIESLNVSVAAGILMALRASAREESA